jgi:hypothetical protein
MAHILVLNRMTPEVASYGDYLDHDVHRVSYLTTPQSVETVATTAERHGCELRVIDLLDEDAVVAAAQEIAASLGRIDRVVALSEIDTLCGARLREELGIPGQDMAGAMLVRDKAMMKRRVGASGVPLARYVSCGDRAAIVELARTCGWPLILKPRLGWASIGIELVRSEAELDAILARIDPQMCICEEFIEAPLFHADGLVIDGEVTFMTLTRYVNTPFAFKQGGMLGGWMVDDPELLESITALTQTVADELSVDGPFHLEAFRPEGSDGWIFSEVGARVGGGPISRLISHAYGVDMLRCQAALQAGLGGRGRLNGHVRAGARPPVVAGYLCYPEPRERPCRVTGVSSMAGRVPEIYSETLPPVGAMLDGTRHYLDIAVEFLLEAPDSASLRAAIERTEAEFRLETELVAAPTASS